MKFLMTLRGDDIAPRFDLTTEVQIVTVEGGEVIGEPRTILLSGGTGEELCGLVVKEGVGHVICGAIEETHYEYLVWKKVKVTDGIIGPWEEALSRSLLGRLAPGSILPGARPGGGKR